MTWNKAFITLLLSVLFPLKEFNGIQLKQRIGISHLLCKQNIEPSNFDYASKINVRAIVSRFLAYLQEKGKET